MSKTILTIVTGSAFILAATAQEIPSDPNKFHIFLLLGQSNMQGYATDGSGDTEGNPRILKLNGWDSWEVAKDPLSNSRDEGVGPGMAFAKKLISEDEEIVVGLVPMAVGATKLDEWAKGGVFYDSVLHAASVARRKGVIKGILWHQGEHDSILWTDMQTYNPRLTQYQLDIRKDLNAPELPFITGGFVNGIKDKEEHPFAKAVNERTKQNMRDNYNVGYVRTKDLPHLSDNLHFTVAGQQVLGERYADEYLRITGHWTETVRESLEERATELEDGWKSVPGFGTYFDENYPIIKHAQLGWVKVEGLADGSMRLTSKFWGEMRTFLDNPDKGLYIYIEDIDPEVTKPGVTYFTNLDADIGFEKTFFNHSTNTWSATLADEPDFDETGDYYHTAEKVFQMAQTSSTKTINASYAGELSDLYINLRATEENRIFTIIYATEAYHWAHENETQANLKTFWKDKSLEIIRRIDSYLIDAQVAYQNYFGTYW